MAIMPNKGDRIMVETLITIDIHRYASMSEEIVTKTYDCVTVENVKDVSVFRAMSSDGETVEVAIESCVIHKGIAIYFAEWSWDEEGGMWQGKKSRELAKA